MTDNARIVREALEDATSPFVTDGPCQASMVFDGHRCMCFRCVEERADAAIPALTTLETELATTKAELARAREAIMAAIPWLEEQGCDCGVDEPGTCALCLCESMLSKGERG